MTVRTIGIRELKNRASAILRPFPRESEEDLLQAQREAALHKLDALAERFEGSRTPPSRSSCRCNKKGWVVVLGVPRPPRGQG
jgi:hypothetical protein